MAALRDSSWALIPLVALSITLSGAPFSACSSMLVTSDSSAWHSCKVVSGQNGMFSSIAFKVSFAHPQLRILCSGLLGVLTAEAAPWKPNDDFNSIHRRYLPEQIFQDRDGHTSLPVWRWLLSNLLLVTPLGWPPLVSEEMATPQRRLQECKQVKLQFFPKYAEKKSQRASTWHKQQLGGDESGCQGLGDIGKPSAHRSGGDAGGLHVFL